MAIQFEQLKKKLTEEGLFQDRWKQALPQFPRKIGVITSQSGAVIRDIITTVSRRFPGVEIVLYPTKVQGEGAASEVVANIQKANARTDLDVLIIGRGVVRLKTSGPLMKSRLCGLFLSLEFPLFPVWDMRQTRL